MSERRQEESPTDRDADRLTGRRVLLVDDDPLQCKLYALGLHAVGCAVETAPNGAVGLDVARSFQPDVIVSDVMMPVMDGFRFCRALRQDPAFAAVPIVLHTAHFVEEPDRQLGLDAGATVFVCRKDGVPELLEAMTRALGPGAAVPAPRLDDVAFMERYAGRIVRQLERHVDKSGVAAAQRRLRALFDGASDAVFTVGPDGLITDTNRRGLELLGRTRDQVVGAHIASFAPAGAALQHQAAFERTLTHGQERIADLAVQRPSGEVRDVEISAALVRGDVGDEVLVIIEDTTEARRVARGREIEHVATRVLAAAGSWREAVPALLEGLVKALGCDGAVYQEPTSPAGTLAVVARWPSDGDRARDQDPTDSSLAITIRCDEARHGVMSFQGVSVPRTDPTLRDALAVVARQIGQFASRCRSEERLVESEQRFRRMTESLPHVFWVVSADCTELFYVSPAYETVWGRSCQSLYASLGSWFEAVVPEDREMVASRSLADDRDPLEFQITRPDGSRRAVRVQLRFIRDASGEIALRTGIAEDVTALRELEAKYLQSQKMEAFGQLACGVAHDFNNLLSVINGHAELLLTDLRDGDPMREALEPIMRCGKRAASLTRQLLAFSRRQIMQPRRLDLNAVIGDVQKMLRRLIGEDIELVFRPHPSRPSVMADPGQLEQVLLNLAVNARDAMPRGGTLTIQTDQVEGEPTSIVRVSDTGCGMSAAVQARIFEPFFTTKGPGEGTGLGLATVMGIIEQSGGTITVESRPGWGATFTLKLPSGNLAAVEEAAPKTVPRSPAKPGHTVLVVEDEPDVAMLAEQILKRRGYHVLAARDADHALALARGHDGRIDLLLTDVLMPRVSGPEVARCVRSIRAGTPVLYMSGYMDDVLRRNGLEADLAAILHKPFSPEALCVAVDEAIRSRG